VQLHCTEVALAPAASSEVTAELLASRAGIGAGELEGAFATRGVGHSFETMVANASHDFDPAAMLQPTSPSMSSSPS